MSTLPAFPDRHDAHERFRQQHAAHAAAAGKLEDRISALRLVTFVGAAIAATSALTGAGLGAVLASLGLGASFVGAVAYHSRVAERRRVEDTRAQVHARHLRRMEGECVGRSGTEQVAADHVYARDIDIVGTQGLVARLDTTHTARGARALVRALCEPTSAERARSRQRAVCELASKWKLRRELEVFGTRGGRWGQDLDDAPFARFTQLPSLFQARPWLKPLMWSLPTLTLGGLAAASVTTLGAWIWLLPLMLQLWLLWWTRRAVHGAFDWITGRLDFASPFVRLLQLVEEAQFDSDELKSLQRTLLLQGELASRHMQRLARYEAYAQLRTQGPVYLVINALTLWDLFCLERLEHFNRVAGPHCAEWFQVIGEVEALCSLATLADTDPDATFPELVETGGILFEQVAHPLLSADQRVANDVSLEGARSAWVITGSNMAGKSTLLRAVGLNTALAMAGGPVIAKHARITAVRLRASMRIDDSLQQGASYFRAELNKLQCVVADLEQAPPVMFLLDEVLRGTNSRARSIGARSVVRHLLRGGAMGLVATHDAGLADLQDESELAVHNYHFTDVFEDNEMRFDYRLRPGVVQSSNALRLLQMAGIAVEGEEDACEQPLTGRSAEHATTKEC